MATAAWPGETRTAGWCALHLVRPGAARGDAGAGRGPGAPPAGDGRRGERQPVASVRRTHRAAGNFVLDRAAAGQAAPGGGRGDRLAALAGRGRGACRQALTLISRAPACRRRTAAAAPRSTRRTAVRSRGLAGT